MLGGQIGHSALDVVSGAEEKRNTFSLDLLVIILLMQPGIQLVSVTARVHHWPTFNLTSRCFSARLLASWAGQARSVLPLVSQYIDG